MYKVLKVKRREKVQSRSRTTDHRLWSQTRIPADGGPAIEEWVVEVEELDIYEKFPTYTEAMDFMCGLNLDWRLIES